MDSSPLVIDIETHGTDPWEGELLCIASSRDGNLVIEERVSPSLRALLSDPDIPKACHSLFDVRYLSLAGYKVRGPVFNTQHMAHLLNENQPLNLEWLVKKWCGIKMDKRLRQVNKTMMFEMDDGLMVPLEGIRFNKEAFKQLKEYCGRDTRDTEKLYYTLRAEIDKRQLTEHWLKEEVPFSSVLLDMECAGMPIDMDYVRPLREDLLVRRAELEKIMHDELGYLPNLNSHVQVKQTLYNKLFSEAVKVRKDEPYPPGFQLDVEKRVYAYGTVWRKGLGLKPLYKKNEKGKTVLTSGTPALMVNYPTHPWVELLLEWRKINKVITTYLNVYEQRVHDGRIYGKFNQSGTVTGRLSSSEPNLQNQPAHGDLGFAIRNCFRGPLIVGDHSQLEPRLMAHFSSDPVLLDVYRNNRDIYLVTGEYIFGKKLSKEDVERQISKTIILALGYGAGAAKLAEILAINGFPTSESTAAGYLSELEALYSTLFAWKKAVIAQAKDKGYVKTIGGRYRRLAYTFGDAAWKTRNKGERQSVNAIIQGSAADILRRNMLAVRGYPLRLLAQVHDELVWEHRKEEDAWILAALQDTCEGPGYALDVPLKFEPSFCSSWAEKGNTKPLMEIEDDEEQDDMAS